MHAPQKRETNPLPAFDGQSFDSARSGLLTFIAPREKSAARSDDTRRIVTLVVPCFNEGARLSVAQFSQFAGEHPDFRFLFVNDGSTDSTSDVLARMCDLNPDAFFNLNLGKNHGKGEAVRQGMLLALQFGTDFIGYWDADLATPLAVAADFCFVLDRCPEIDLVMGARVPLLGREVERHVGRLIAGRTFATLAAAALGVGVYDTQCGAKLFRVTERTSSLLACPFISRWAFDVELLGRLIASRGGPANGNQHILEFPLPCWSDVAGSKLRLWHMLRATLDVVRLIVTNHCYSNLKEAMHS